MKIASKDKLIGIVQGVLMSIALIYGIGIMGCQVDTQNVSSVKPKLETVQTKVESSTSSLKTTTSNIKKEALSLLDLTPVEFKPILDTHTNAIITETTKQEDIVKNLESTKTDFTEVKKAADTDANAQKKLLNDNKNLLEDKKKLQDQISSESRKTVVGWSTSCFFIALISGVSYGYTKNRALLGIAATAGIGMLACLMIIQLLPILPFIALGLGILLVFAVGYELLQNKREKAKLSQANVEFVKGLEKVKPRLTVASRKEVFGDGPIDGELATTFSEPTKNIVDNIRLDPTFKRAPSIPATIAIDLNGDGIIDENEIESCRENQVAIKASLSEGQKEFSVGGTKIILK